MATDPPVINPTRASTNSHKIVHNSLWLGLESAFGVLSYAITSVMIARSLGPSTLGVYSYLAWLANMTATVGALGIPATAFKYIGEALGRGDEPLARAIFLKTLRVQIMVASVVTVGALALATAQGELRSVAVILACAIWPAMVIAIPSQLNNARENMAANVPGALLSNCVYVLGVILTLHYSWDLVGLAATVLATRMTEVVIRTIPVFDWVATGTRGNIPAELNRRLVAFSGQSLVLMALSLVVWDRSEVVVIRYFSTTPQLAFYTVVFNVVERLRLLPQIFGTATGATIMAQFGRDPNRMGAVFGVAVRYLMLMAVPVYVGVAVLSGPAMTLAYGRQYSETIPLLTVAALLAIPRVVLLPLNSLLAAADRLNLSVRVNIAVAVLSIILDFVLIPRLGGLGAVIANGLAQCAAVVWLSWVARKVTDIQWPTMMILKIGAASIAMAVSVGLLPSLRSSIADLTLGALVGAITFILSVRVLRILENEDIARFECLSTRMPARIRPGLAWGLRKLGPPLLSTTTTI